MRLLNFIELHLWLFVMDVIAWLGSFGEPSYLWATRRASNCIDWRE